MKRGYSKMGVTIYLKDGSEKVIRKAWYLVVAAGKLIIDFDSFENVSSQVSIGLDQIESYSIFPY